MADAHSIAALGRGTVKICGLREPRHAVAAVEAGADLIGFIFAPSRRQVIPPEAAAAIRSARAAAGPGGVTAVGVFVNAEVDTINRIVEEAGLDLVQLSGDENSSDIEQISVPVIRAVRVRPGESPASLVADGSLDPGHGPIALLLDAYHGDAYGGTGQRADWSVARWLSERAPLLLAGGLTPENVAEAIAAAMPLGVDVSSGVEVEGVKDIARIEAFVRNARTEFAGESVTS